MCNNRAKVLLDITQRPFRLPSVKLELATEVDGPKWSQVAKTGEYKGYANGDDPFIFTDNDFKELVSNFREHPSFQLGSSGNGVTGVVQWDFHHASEMFVGAGDLAVNGSPAQGWVHDVEVRQGPDGSELWALSEFFEPAKTYIKEDRYKWASVAVAFDSIDPISGKNVGLILTSVALTNHPFIEGMLPLVAARQNIQMPVIEQVPETIAVAEPAQRGGNNMEFLDRVATILGVQASEQSVLGALEDAIALRRDLKKNLNASRDTNQALLEATETGASAVDRIGDLVQMLGIGDKEALVSKVTELMTGAEKLKELMPEFDILKKFKEKSEEAEIEADVAMATKQHKLSDKMKMALTILRRAQPIEFAKQFPKLAEPEPQQQTRLTENIVTAHGQQIPVQLENTQEIQTSQEPTINLSMFSGKTKTQKILSYLASKDPNFSKLNHDEQYRIQHQFRNETGV